MHAFRSYIFAAQIACEAAIAGLLVAKIITMLFSEEDKHLIRTRPAFSHSVMASVSVSALGRTNLHFVDPGIKITGQCYRDTLLMRDLLPDIKQSLPDYFTF